MSMRLGTVLIRVKLLPGSAQDTCRAAGHAQSTPTSLQPSKMAGVEGAWKQLWLSLHKNKGIQCLY